MNEKSIIVNGFIWSFAERFGAQIVSFVVSIILARIIEPDAYGAIALVAVFINVANVFATGGFGNALIQKKNADNIDFTTVFYFNIVFSILIYIIVFMFSPVIASFYNMPELIPVLRVMGLRIIIASINSVQRAYVSRKMLFKRFFFSTLGGTLTSAFIGIYFAYKGFGIWALVIQYMTNTCIDTIVLWLTVKWRPEKTFSVIRLKSLFSYGWKLLCSSLLSTVYVELTSLVIGKTYGSSELAYINRGKKFPELIVSQINSAIDTVLFPAMSKHQDDKRKLKDAVRYSIKFSTFCIFPMVFGMACIANDLIIVLLTDKWLSAVIFMQIACISYGLLPINIANIQAIKALGRSDIYLKLDIIKKIIGILLIVLFIKKGVIALAIVEAISNLIGLFINSWPNKKLLNYSIRELIQDILPAFCLSVVMSSGIIIVGKFIPQIWVRITIQTVLGAVLYITVAIILKIPAINDIKIIAVSHIRKGNNL